MSQRDSVSSSVSQNPKAATPTCTRCNSSIISGHAYELGGDRWHTHCFTCYKCDKKLTCKSDFLVLGTGTLICFSCSDSCKGCGKKIDDLAIILSSSNEAYCSDCFKCCKCTKRIDDLRYAKTRRGLFCISCHEKLLAKRKHAEEKKRRLQKELPSVPSQTSLSSYITTPEADSKKIPLRSANRPVSPRKMGDYVVSDSVNSSSDGSKQTTPTMESQGNTAPSNISDHRSSDMETVGTKHLLDSAASIDRKLTSSVDSSTTTFETSIKSNSWSVVAQFLEDDDDETSEYTTTGDTPPMRDDVRASVSSLSSGVTHLEERRRSRVYENHNNHNPEEKKRLLHQDESIDETVTDQGHMNSSTNRDEGRYDAATPKRHTRNYSLDDVLQRTLTKDDNDNDNPRIIEGLALPTGQKQKRALLNRTPLRNKDDPLLSKSPVSHRRGFIMSESGEFINELLSSPSSVGILSGETDLTSSTGQPEVAQSYTAKSVEQGVNHEHSVSRSYKTPNNSKFPKLENPPSLVHEQQSNFTTSASSASLDPKHVRSLSGFSNGNGHVNGPTVNHKATSKLTRSTSVRSKVANLIHGKKSIGSARSMQQDPSPFDTHTGWGVSSGMQGHGTSPLKSNPGPKFSPHGRGQSDSTIYSQVSPKLAKKQTFDHSRSQSGTAGSNIAVHITPPISANASPMPIMPISKVDGIFPEERTPTNDEFIRRDLINEDLLMRQLRLEVNDLQNNKMQLTAEVDHLKKYKEQLKLQIEQLKAERKDLSAASSDSLDEEHDVAVKQVVTATASSHAKPRFWKLFGGKPAFSNANSASSSSGANVSGSPFNISHPILQNPNEFDDWNLKTVNSGSELYGSSLVARVAYEGNEVPMIITTCMNHIESKAEYLNSEGLYRKSGSQLLIEQIENEFIQWQPDEPTPERIYEFLSQDIHAVTSVLKRYLRKLPNPLYTFQVYEPLMQLVREERLCTTVPLKNSKKNSMYRTIVNMLVNVLKLLPTEHLRLLKVICQHVNLVAQYQQANLMNMNNLALVFAPGIIRDYSGEKDITDMKERNYLVGFVFINYEDIFASLYTV